MKKVIMLAAVVAALASCQSKANKAAEAEADSIAIEAMSPTVEATEVYEGTLPAADGPGIRYVLTLNMLADANDTTYTLDMTYLDASRVEVHYHMPLNEIIYDFFDALKSRSRGYASFDYELKGYEKSELVKLDILIKVLVKILLVCI